MSSVNLQKNFFFNEPLKNDASNFISSSFSTNNFCNKILWEPSCYLPTIFPPQQQLNNLSNKTLNTNKQAKLSAYVSVNTQKSASNNRPEIKKHITSSGKDEFETLVGVASGLVKGSQPPSQQQNSSVVTSSSFGVTSSSFGVTSSSYNIISSLNQNLHYLEISTKNSFNCKSSPRKPKPKNFIHPNQNLFSRPPPPYLPPFPQPFRYSHHHPPDFLHHYPEIPYFNPALPPPFTHPALFKQQTDKQKSKSFASLRKQQRRQQQANEAAAKELEEISKEREEVMKIVGLNEDGAFNGEAIQDNKNNNNKDNKKNNNNNNDDNNNDNNIGPTSDGNTHISITTPTTINNKPNDTTTMQTNNITNPLNSNTREIPKKETKKEATELGQRSEVEDQSMDSGKKESLISKLHSTQFRE